MRGRQRHRKRGVFHPTPTVPITFASLRYLDPADPQNGTMPKTGGDDRVRTDDPLLAKQVLSQLSYAPNQSI
jgi:hypothetical protein